MASATICVVNLKVIQRSERKQPSRGEEKANGTKKEGRVKKNISDTLTFTESTHTVSVSNVWWG